MKKILIVDDKLEVVELIAATLKGEGYRLITASEGREALEKIGTEKPDLVLLDVIMPEMDGFEVLIKAKKDPKTKGIPIIMLSAEGQKSDKDKGIELGAEDYIIKPFSPSHLLIKIEKIMA